MVKNNYYIAIEEGLLCFILLSFCRQMQSASEITPIGFFLLKMFKRIILWSALLLWITLAIFLSRQTGVETISQGLRLAKSIIDFFHLNIDLNAFHLLLRKAAHIGIYFVTGVLSTGACIATFPRKAAVSIALLLTEALSVFDELQKIHIEGRHCQWDEVGLNMFSAVIGIGIVLLASYIKKRRAK